MVVVSAELVQQHLDGRETPIEDFEWERPATYLWDEDAGEWVRRIDVDDPRQYLEPSELPVGDGDDGDTVTVRDGDSDEEVGSWYDVTLHVEHTYRFRIPAFSKHRAKDIADEWKWDTSPSDAHTLHTTTREISSITLADLPDDYDQYGGEPLHEALDRVEDGDSA